MKTVAYSCAFVPCEWIAAHGLRARRVFPSLSQAGAAGSTEGLCAFTEAFVNWATSEGAADAIVATTVCDLMRRAPELIARRGDIPVFLMNVPATWQGGAVRRLYADELKRLGNFLVDLGGTEPSAADLAAVMLEYDSRRSDLRKLAPRLTAREYSQSVLALSDRDAALPDPPRDVVGGDGVPLAVVGGEMIEDDLRILDLIEDAGGRVVLNATDGGERALPAPLDRSRVARDPFAELVDAYFAAIPHACRRPNDGLYRYLDDELARRDVRGIIFRRYPWCDTWNAEFGRLSEWADIPVLAVDTVWGSSDLGRLAGRIQAFMEVVR